MSAEKIPISNIIPIRKNEEYLTPLQKKAIKLFSSGTAANEVANELKVSIKTLSRWRNKPFFSAELTKQRKLYMRDALQQGSADILAIAQRMGPAAMQCLIDKIQINRDGKIALAVARELNLLKPLETNLAVKKTIRVTFGTVDPPKDGTVELPGGDESDDTE